jgi:predicted ATPase
MTKRELPSAKVSFEIDRLGPIRDSVIDFKPFLLFSGESNTGKSYTVMSVYYLMFMLDNDQIISELTAKLFDIKKIEKELLAQKEIEVDFPGNITGEFERLYNKNIQRFMVYMLGDDDFSCKVNLKLDIPESYPFKSRIRFALKNVKNGETSLKFQANLPNYQWGFWPSYISIDAKNPEIDLWDELKFFVRGIYERLLFEEGFLKKLFLPPARGAFSGIAPSQWKDFYGIGMYKEFTESLDRLRYSSFNIDEDRGKLSKVINSLLLELLNGKINVERESFSYTIRGTNKKIPLSAASSSVKELFPLYLLLKRVRTDHIFLCIEEPEAHLHASLQRIAAQLLAYIVNHEGFIQVTTHSDFFMNQINNLLKLHAIKDKNPVQFKSILKETGIREDFVLNPETVNSYFFQKKKDRVEALRLDISMNGIPMKSFEKTFDQSVNETRKLREALADHAG